MNKCTVAFFFLFLLHGTSIGNGQQGILYNVLQIGDVAEIEAENYLQPQNLN